MQRKELVRETAWSREFRLGPETYTFESKFARDGLQVSAASVRQSWPRWDAEERLTFTTAFILKPVLTPEDQEILRFLMETAGEPVWMTLSHTLPRYQDREAALAFLLERAASAAHAGGYFDALEQIADPRAVDVLRRRYEQYRQALSPLEQHGLHSDLSDYQQCCRALWKLTALPEYETALQELLSHPDEAVRRRSRLFLTGQAEQ